MSFPRARIQRFNEFSNDVPPPGSYDPKIKNKIKGLVIEKTDRFLDSKSISSSCADCNTSTSSKSASLTSSSAFKVPQLPKKKTTTKSVLTSPSVKTNKKCDSKYDPTKELADLKVECINKDRTIQEYEKQMEEMKDDIQRLEKQLMELKDKQIEIEARHKKDLDEMTQDRHLADIEMKTKMQKVHEDFQMEISKMKDEECKLKTELINLAEIRNDLESKLQQRQHLVIQLQSQLSMLECELDECKAENENLAAESVKWDTTLTANHETEIKILREDFQREKDDLLNQYQSERREIVQLQDNLHFETTSKKCSEEKLAKLQCLYSDVKSRLEEAEGELQEIKDHHSQVLKNHSQEIETLMHRHAEEIARLIQRSEEFKEECATEREQGRVIEEKAMSKIQEAKNSVDEEVRKAVEKYAGSLLLMESKLQTAQENLAQKETEAMELSIQVEELKNSSATKESSNQSLQSELDRTEAELAEKREEVKVLKDQLRNEAAEMVTRRRRLDLVMAENQLTVSAISERLAKSDTEVERLQSELEWERIRLREHKDLLNTMRTNSTHAYDQLLNLLQQLDGKKEDIDQLVVNNVIKFDTMKSLFDAKIKELNDVAAAEITRLEAECDKANGYNRELKQQLTEMTGKLGEARDMLLRVEEQYDRQSIELAQLELTCHKLDKLYKETNKKYEESTAQLMEQQVVIDKAKSYIAEFTDKLDMMQERRSCKEHSVKIEKDKDKVDKVEAEPKSELGTEFKSAADLSKFLKDRELLESNLRKIEAEYKDLADKYAAVIGHNNHKQKIQHMIQMKKEKLQLKEDVEAAKRIIAQQQRTIEKLRSEERNRQLLKEKENLPSSVVASPHKPTTPLKDRNI
ncbi:hyaluronan mediated motility receptor-like [Neodiprion virginianus]|uniref:hyaluronan mediated motility receptor-like n=1 Tax=Neodiprion virginianus TaxID=2961670 RepID=UPI001EE6B35D|nr:hyaluronan mediated motility receptor-like [Neodiprion virginianus]